MWEGLQTRNPKRRVIDERGNDRGGEGQTLNREKRQRVDPVREGPKVDIMVPKRRGKELELHRKEVRERKEREKCERELNTRKERE